MPAPATSLPELVDQLGRTFSPFERLKILGRAWSLLRTMTPDQRLAVAAQLGLDRADEVVEAIATRGGTKASPVLLSMIDQAQKKGTGHLPQLINDLRDPGRRAKRMRQGAAALEDAAVTAVTAVTATTAAPGEVPWLPPGATTAAPPAPAKPPQPMAPPPQPAPPPPVAAPAQVPPPPVQAALAPEPKPVEASAPKPAPQPPRPQPAPAPVRTAAREPVADRLAAVPSLTARFRVLRGHLEDLRKASAAGLGPVVQAFPDGWARRRALLELFRAGIPGSLEDSLALVETLGSERDRLWCLGALTEARAIPEPERGTLLAAVSSPTARRRLAVRMGGTVFGTLFVLALLLSGCAGAPQRDQRRVISTDRAPAALASYSQAIQVGDTLYLAGQIGLDPATRELVPGGLQAEARRSLDNCRAVLEAAGFTLKDVVQVQVFLADLGDYNAFNEVYAGYFPPPAPARAAVAVAGLPRGARVEVVMTAVRQR